MKWASAVDSLQNGDLQVTIGKIQKTDAADIMIPSISKGYKELSQYSVFI